MLNMSDTKVIVNSKLDTPNGLGVDWIANNIYWTDNEYKVKRNSLVSITDFDGPILPCFLYIRFR